MKCKLHQPCLIFFLACYVTLAGASPTSNEFEICHKMAAATLEMCLNQNQNTVDENCWDISKRRNATCYAKVNESHAPDRKKMAAEKAAMEKMRKEAK